MPNTFQYVDWLTMEGLRILKNKLQCAQFANTDYNNKFTKEFAVGETIRVPLPQRFLIREGLGYSPQSINRIYTTVSCDQIFGVDFQWDDAEAALKLERGQERIKQEYLEPAMVQIAQEADSRFARFAAQNANNIVGVQGVDPTSFQTMNQARQRLVELACPPGTKRGMIIPPSVNTSLVNAAIQYFNPTDAIAKQYKEGYIGYNSGFQWYESMSLHRHTAGTWQNPVTVNTAPSSGATSIVLNTTSGDTFKIGDVFSIDNVYAVNPTTRQVTTYATDKQFVVTQDVTASGATTTVQFQPPMYGPGSQYQNIDALPIVNAAVTLFPGTSSPNGDQGVQGLAITKDAFALVGVKLEMPKAVEMSSQTRDPETGLSVRFVRAWDPIESKMINRFDVLMGFGNLYPDNCCVRVLCA